MLYDLPNKRIFLVEPELGEKDFEEFYTSAEELDMQRFKTIGVIKNDPSFDETRLEHFLDHISQTRQRATWDKPEIVELFNYMIPDFNHKETGKYLDGRM